MGSKKLSEDQENKIIRLHLKGVLDGEIAKMMGISHYTVGKRTRAYWAKKMNESKTD